MGVTRFLGGPPHPGSFYQTRYHPDLARRNLWLLTPLQVPSESVFVTRFMGGYTENVPPDEFDALPVRRLVASLRSMMVIVPENPLLGTY